MKYYDLHVHSAFSEGESTIDQLAQRAKELGYIGICFAEYYEGRDQLHKLKECVAEAVRKSGIEILLGFEARNEKELRKLADMRKMFDILLARGGDLKMNRAAVETREVDILTHPEHGRYDCGMNHVMARLAKKNNVAIELNFREILISDKKSRARTLANMRENISLAKKYGMKIILCSGAISHWEMKSPLCMAAIAEKLGMKSDEAKSGIASTPIGIVESSKDRRSERFVMPGVRIR